MLSSQVVLLGHGPPCQGLPGFPTCASPLCPIREGGTRRKSTCTPPQGSLSNFNFLGWPRGCSPPSRGRKTPAPHVYGCHRQ